MSKLELPLFILVRLIVAASCLLICLFGYLIFKRMREIQQQRKTQLYIKQTQTVWYDYLINDARFTPRLVPNHKFEIYGVEEIFQAYVNNLANPDLIEKISQFSNRYFKLYYQKQLKSLKWSIRMNALYRIAEFHIDRLLDECKKRVQRKETREEYFQILKILAIFDADTFLQEILHSVVPFSEYEYKKLLSSVHSHILENLTQHFAELRPTCQYSIIDILGVKRNGTYTPFLESQLQNADAEIRIRSLKSIYEIGFVRDLQKYVAFVGSPLWEERLMTAKVLGHSPLDLSLPYLERLLQDSSWWVRSQAAKTIGDAKGGKEKLQRFIESASDSYAIDMANEILQKGL